MIDLKKKLEQVWCTYIDSLLQQINKVYPYKQQEEILTLDTITGKCTLYNGVLTYKWDRKYISQVVSLRF
jgi:hypothetical protein